MNNNNNFEYTFIARNISYATHVCIHEEFVFIGFYVENREHFNHETWNFEDG